MTQPLAQQGSVPEWVRQAQENAKQAEVQEVTENMQKKMNGSQPQEASNAKVK